MIVVGVTGSIGMGKSTVAMQFASLGVKMCNADAIVHTLMEHDRQVIKAIKETFGSAVKGEKIDRAELGKIVFADAKKREKLEAILHPRVQQVEERFIAKQRRLGAKMVVLDIPLLFETKGEARVHISVLATAPHFIQSQRVKKRPGMTEEKFRRIQSIQMSEREKRQRADIIVATGLGKAHSFRQVKQIMEGLGLA